MSDLFFNKIAGAGLAAALGFIGISKISNMVVHADIPEVPAYSVYVAGESAALVEVEAPFPQAEWIAGIDAVKGAKVFKKCTSCHNANEGGKNGTGPALWNVVGRAAGAGADFNYSPAMANSGLTWNYEELDGYLESPKTYLPKNKMAFIGVKKASDRAAVIEYLRLAANAPIAPLTAPAAIEGLEEAIETVVEDLGVEDAVDVVEEITDAVIEESTETTPEPNLPSENVVQESVEDAANIIEDVAEEVVETPVEEATDVVEEVVEEIEDVVPTPEPEDGGN